jgi:hypothetical protein
LCSAKSLALDKKNAVRIIICAKILEEDMKRFLFAVSVRDMKKACMGV